MGAALTTLATDLGISPFLLVVALAWSLVWKGIALWKSARNSHRAWFAACLLLQTFGIVEILYVYVFSKIKLTGIKQKNNLRRKKRIRK